MFVFTLIVALLWTNPSSTLGEAPIESNYFGNLLTEVFGSTESARNICDRENKWWEFAWGSNPSYNGIRVGKHAIANRDITWFSAAIPALKIGVTTSTKHNEAIVFDSMSLPANYMHTIFGSFCTTGTMPQLSGAPSSRCAVIGGLAQCPVKDDWSRVFMWFNWSKEPFLNIEPIGVEMKKKSGEGNLRVVISMSVDTQLIPLVDVLVEDIGDKRQRTLKIPLLGLKASTTYKQTLLKASVVTKSDCSIVNSAGKKIVHIKENYTVYNEKFMHFEDFSFGAPMQDQLRNEAVSYKFNFKDFPRIRRTSLYELNITARDLSYCGNETHNVWQGGEIERWKFVNASSPLMSSNGIIEQIYVYNDNTYSSGYEVSKIKFPVFHAAMNRVWEESGADVKKVYVQFNRNSILPSVELTYSGDSDWNSVDFKFPTPDYGMSLNFTYKYERDGVISFSVRKTELWAGYENPVEIISGYVQHGSYHALFVIQKNDVFAPHYTRLLTFLALLREEFQSNYGQHLYTRLIEEIGENEIQKLLQTIREVSTLNIMYKSIQQLLMIFNPEAWQVWVSVAYDMLQTYGKVEDTENEYIVYYDLRSLPFSYVLKYFDKFLQNKV